MRNIHIKFQGRVQGVFFRRNVTHLCHDLNISGWIRNIPDGTVEGEFQGESGAVEELLQSLTGNFMGAFITNRIVTELPTKNMSGFTIVS